jgi:hypothetical protein
MSKDDVFGKRYGGPSGSDPTVNSNDKVFGKRYQAPKPICDPEPVRSRQQPSGPQIFFQTIQNAGPNAQADVLIQCPFPCNSFFISSVKGGTETSSVMFHLAKLGKNYIAPAINAVGNEPWISLNINPAAGPIYRTVIRFKETILQFFLDIGFEGGAGPITIACVADDAIQITGGLYT